MIFLAEHPPLEPNDARVPKHSRYWKNDPLPPHLAAARLGGGAGRGGRVTPHRAHRSGHQPLLYTAIIQPLDM